MGKSKVDKMRPNHLTVKINGLNDKKSWQNGFNNNNNNNNNENGQSVNKNLYALPEGMEHCNHQVGGHMSDGVHLGLMKRNGVVYKPITSKTGDREIDFYEKLRFSKDPILRDFKEFVPKYFGAETHLIDGKEIKYIALDDVTKDFREPCIMDVKIGRVTYDPLASQEKIMKEKTKYIECKRDLGIAIPGFQVYNTSNGKLSKYGKDYGKQLNKETAIDAFRIFLNGTSSYLNRSLIIQMLTSLWRIQNWARKQRQIKLIASSILLVYDARKLRELTPKIINPNKINTRKIQRTNSLTRPISVVCNEKLETLKAGFSGQLAEDGPIFGCQTSPTRIKQINLNETEIKRSRPTLKRMHSFQNNYDKDLQSMKNDYNAILDELVSDKKHKMWVSVKIIDFTHVFPNNEIDTNFLEGLNNLIKVFEDFLIETEIKINL
ncbi:inositol polyphosphate multikinase [Onthophagus taurus]|uniref:inositol polyphosphate multikinase n=1 Tax=Onthophagus taurus TaxID=166361 RepID=UPI0039BE8CCB